MEKLTINSLVVLIGFCAQSVIAFMYVDNRFDQLEDQQLIETTLYGFRWESFKAKDAWQEFKRLNPQIEGMKIPDIESINHRYKKP